MGRIRILSDLVANQIAAGEVVERPASVVKELLENSIDAGATRIRIEVEAGGRKLIRIADNGHGMVRDDALLAFERHATSKLRTSDDLLSIATLGFRGEALPSIASVSRLQLETRVAEEPSGTLVEIAGGNIVRVEDAGLPVGTTIIIRDLFFNTPARRKFLKSEQTELSHIAALVTHYALVHPTKHLELHSATQALLIAPAVANPADRLFQIFGKDTNNYMLPTTAELDFTRAGLPEPPPWKRDADYTPPEPGYLRLTGFVSKPELQKLNRNSIYIFVNQRLIRDKLILHALSEAYRNILPPTSYPRRPPLPRDAPARGRRQRSPRKNRSPFPPTQLCPRLRPRHRPHHTRAGSPCRQLRHRSQQRPTTSLQFVTDRRKPTPRRRRHHPPTHLRTAIHPAIRTLPHSRRHRNLPRPTNQIPHLQPRRSHRPPIPRPLRLLRPLHPHRLRPTRIAKPRSRPQQADTLTALSTLKPLGQLRDSFILATNEEGLWIIDQHVAHERILFEKILRDRDTEQIQRQRLLMPLLIDLLPAQMITFSEIAEELDRNGFEAEPFGPRTLAVKAAPSVSKVSNSSACSKRSSPSRTATSKPKTPKPAAAV